MKYWLVIAAAGAVGAVLRYAMSTGVHKLLGQAFPFGTLLVNITGSFLIGYFFVILLERSLLGDLWRLAILVGLLGSFTTFSTFSLETINLTMAGAYGKAISNVMLSVVLCLFGTVLGIAAGRHL